MPNTHHRRRRDETVLSRRVGSVYMNLQLAHDDCRRIRSTIWKVETGQTDCVCVCFCVCLTTWILIDTDNFFNSDDMMTSLLKKLSIFIKIGVIKRYKVCLVSFKIVDRIRRQSPWASCEFMYTPPTTTWRRVGATSAVCTHRQHTTQSTQRNSTVLSHRRCVLGFSVVVSALALINVVNQHQDRSLIGWLLTGR